MAVHVAAVSEELLQVLADLGSLLRQCEAELTDRAWSALRRAIARQLDGYLFERMLCEMHCTRSGLQQLEHDMQALFGLFDAATGATAGRRARARGGSGGGGGGAALFRRTSDTLALLRLPAERLESLQAALWPHEDGGGGGGACKLTTAQHSTAQHRTATNQLQHSALLRYSRVRRSSYLTAQHAMPCGLLTIACLLACVVCFTSAEGGGGGTSESGMEALGMAGLRYLDTETAKLTHGAWPRVYQ
jgi:hypothetical protein